MELKEINSEIKELIQNALQVFLNLVVKDKWQERLYEKAKNAVINNKRRAKYKKVYNILDSMDDKSQFTTKDMDTSLIVEVTYYDDLGNKVKKHKKDKFVEIAPNTQIAIYNLSKSRNDISHITGNESLQELYVNGLVALHNLNDFLETVDCYELSIDKDERNAFKKECQEQIRKLSKLLEEAHTKIIQNDNIQESINRKLDSNNLNKYTESKYEHNKKTNYSNKGQISKTDCTIGNIPNSKKMRLGRVHKKKTDSSATIE